MLLFAMCSGYVPLTEPWNHKLRCRGVTVVVSHGVRLSAGSSARGLWIRAETK
jgi:hypothetical protein